MRVHPSVNRLSHRLWIWSPAVGAVALAAFLLSLMRGAFPGESAALIAESAGLTGSSDVAHPVFSLLARHVAALDLFSLTARLNLFSAVCGTLSAMLLYAWAGWLVLCSACEDGGGGARNELMEEADALPFLQPEVEVYNRRILKIATVSGMVAAFLLTFLVPTWSAATRLDAGLFNLLLALAALSIYPAASISDCFLRQALSVFYLSLGCSSLPYFSC